MPDALRYYFDEQIDAAVATGLRARGIDLLTTVEAGRASRSVSDQDQLSFATAAGRVLVTRDRDSVALAATRLPHAGIIYIQRTLSIGEMIDYLEIMAHVTAPEELQDILVYCAW